MRRQGVRCFVLFSIVLCTVTVGCGSTNRAAPIVDRSPAPVVTSPVESRTVDSRKREPELRPAVAEKSAVIVTVTAPQAIPKTQDKSKQAATEVVGSTPPAQENTIQNRPLVAAKPYREGDWRPEYYLVQKGDTLYSIALEYGQAYQDLANWNRLTDPTYIQIGQQLRLFPEGGQVDSATSESVALPPASLPDAGQSGKAVSVVPVFSDPKAYRADYSKQALADIRRTIDGEVPTTVIPTNTTSSAAPTAVSKAPAPAKSVQAGRAGLPDERLNWEWPAPGKVIYRFAQGPNKKGVAIEGDPGQAIVSSAPGKVVYSGSGLRGYGNLLIIKHNATYLSVYAHNSQLLVREGQVVAQGQKIAVMGSAAGGTTALHFEIRRLGKPIDPLTQLPGRPS